MGWWASFPSLGRSCSLGKRKEESVLWVLCLQMDLVACPLHLRWQTVPVSYWAQRHFIQQWQRGIMRCRKWWLQDCVETHILGRFRREAEQGFLCRKVKSPVMAFPEVPCCHLQENTRWERQSPTVQWGVGGKCLGSLGARETCGTEGACVERKNCIWRKLKPGFWHLKLKCFHRQIFNSFLAAESRVWERTRFGVMCFLGVTL